MSLFIALLFYVVAGRISDQCSFPKSKGYCPTTLNLSVSKFG